MLLNGTGPRGSFRKKEGPQYQYNYVLKGTKTSCHVSPAPERLGSKEVKLRMGKYYFSKWHNHYTFLRFSTLRLINLLPKKVESVSIVHYNSCWEQLRINFNFKKPKLAGKRCYYEMYYFYVVSTLIELSNLYYKKIKIITCCFSSKDVTN